MNNLQKINKGEIVEINKELAEASSKLELTGTSNNGYRHEYSCVKKESFKKAFFNFMSVLGFEEKKIKRSFIIYTTKYDRGGSAYDEPRKMKIKDMIDICDHFQNERYDVDVFYGADKIIILVRVRGREELVKTIIDKSEWKKFPEISPRVEGISVLNKQKIMPNIRIRRAKKDIQ